MMLKHVPKAYKLWKSFGIRNYGAAPHCYDIHKGRTFSTWTWRKMETGIWHQGELGADGMPDGMGVFITPTSDLSLGYYNAETDTCTGVMITADQRLCLGKWNNTSPLDID